MFVGRVLKFNFKKYMRLKIRNNKLKNKEYNFLNNQNYILWKTEKKKLLSKFFVEKIFLFLINFLYYFTQVFIFVLAPTLILLIFSFFIFPSFNPYYFFVFCTLFFTIFIYIQLSKEKFYTKIDLKKLFYSKNYFSLILVLFILIFLFILPYWLNSWIYYSSFNSYLPYFWYYYPLLIILFLYFSKYTFKIFKINYALIIFFPFILLLSIFIYFLSFIYIFLLKWINWYKIIKKEPKAKFLEKFKKIEKNYAENKYYKIKLK